MPEVVAAKRRGPRLGSREYVRKEIATVYRLARAGSISDNESRARVYTLQTMLSALKLAEAEGPPPEPTQQARDARLLRTYDLAPGEYERLCVEQDGKCAICRKAKRLYVDHRHDPSRKVRGLLCCQCNTAIGVIEGWYAQYGKQATEYLCRK